MQELIGTYVLDAVEPYEADIIDAHLIECLRCRAEVATLRETATLLSFSGSAAPEGVWSKIAAALEEPPPPLQLVRTRRTVRRSRTWPAAAAAAAVIIGVLGVFSVQERGHADQLTAISSRSRLNQAAATAAVSPAAHTVQLTSGDRAQAAAAVLLPSGSGYLINGGLAPLGPGRTYQLWGVIGAQTISLGVLGPEPTVTAFTADTRLAVLAITAEQAGGATAPTMKPIVEGRVSTFVT